MKNKIMAIGIGLMLITVVFITITPTISATVTYPVAPDSLLVPPPDAPSGVVYEDFETGVDGQVVSTTIPGVQFVTTAGQDWVYGDWRTGDYNGKYPNGAYTSQGNVWTWLDVSQGSGIIDFTEGCASYISVCTSTYSGLTIDAYADDGTWLANSGWATNNINTGQMTRLSISRPTADIGYVIVHDSGNYWLIDRIWTDAPGFANQQPVADAGGPYSGKVGEKIQFDASDSYDPDYLFLRYRWDWTNDGIWDTSWSIVPIKSHKYGSPGTYTVKLQVKDWDGSTDTDIATVEIEESDDFYFVHLTDVHIDSTNDFWDSGGDRTDRLTHVLDQIKQRDPPPAFLVVSGDIAESGNQNLGGDYVLFINCFDDVDYNSNGQVTMLYINPDCNPSQKIPVYICPGNHDHRWIGGLLTYDSIFQYPGENNHHRYTVDYLNDFRLASLDSGSDDLLNMVGDKFLPEGNGLNQEDINWLDSVLNNDKIKVIFLHHPVINNHEYENWEPGIFPWEWGRFVTRHKWGDGCFNYKQNPFMNLCEQYKIPFVLCGHTHRSIVYTCEGAGSGRNGLQMDLNKPYCGSDGEGNYFLTYSGDDYTGTLYVQTCDVKDGDAYRINRVEDNAIKVYETDYASTIFIEISSPNNTNNYSSIAMLHIYDSEGNHLGFNESSGTIENEIPCALYNHYHAYNDSPPVIEASVYSNDSYTFVIKSPNDISVPQPTHIECTYHLEESGEIKTEYNTVFLTNTTSLTIFTNGSFTDHTAFVDYNNDGVFDQEIQPESTLQGRAPLPLLPPVGPRSSNFNEPCSFTINTIDPENNSILYLFDWGDGLNSSWQGLYQSGDNCTINHSWLTQGIYQVRVKAMDILGYETQWSEEHTIFVGYKNINPIAWINVNESGQVNQPISFDGSGSYDPDGTIVSYEWDFGDGNTDTGVNPQHVYNTGGMYTVNLTVIDDDGLSNKTSINIFINNPPTADFSYSPQQPNVYDEVSFISQSTDNDGFIVARFWDFGDGTSGLGEIVTHKYCMPGEYIVTLTVTDNEGLSDIIQKTIEVLIILANIDIDPDTLNLNSGGKWITCYIEFPSGHGYNVTEINISTILLNDVVPAESKPTNISDYDNDSILDLMVKFDRQDVIDILEPGENVEITATGKLFDETIFEGTDYINVI